MHISFFLYEICPLERLEYVFDGQNQSCVAWHPPYYGNFKRQILWKGENSQEWCKFLGFHFKVKLTFATFKNVGNKPENLYLEIYERQSMVLRGKSSEVEKGLMAVLGARSGLRKCWQFPKFCQKLQFTIKEGLVMVGYRLGCVLAQKMLTICNLSLRLGRHKSEKLVSWCWATYCNLQFEIRKKRRY